MLIQNADRTTYGINKVVVFVLAFVVFFVVGFVSWQWDGVAPEPWRLRTLVLTPLLTFMAMNELDISANLMSLGGLAIAIGLMVDGSVVVVENAFLQLGRQAKSGESSTRVILRAVVRCPP